MDMIQRCLDLGASTRSGTRGAVTQLVLAISLLASVPVQAADLGNRETLETFVDGYARAMMKSQESPVGTVAIAHDGELILAKGYGYQDLETRTPVDPYKTLFRPGSVSKLFTWVAVMQQVERGKLDLDADVNKYLKNFQIADTWPGKPITLRHIMTHTSGFEDGALGYLIIDDPARIMPLAEAMKRYQPRRINPPGVQTAYSNYATALAGLIVANVSGLSFNQYIQQNIFDVLGMHDASFVEPLPKELAQNMAGSYAVEGGGFTRKPYEIISNFGPAGALAASATDMLKFAEAIRGGGEYQGKRILQAATVEQMLKRQFSHDPRMLGMGLGFYETGANGVLLVGHGGDTGAFHSELVIDRANALSFFVSFGGSGGGAVRSGFKQAFYDEFFPAAESRLTPPADFANRAGRYAGTYQFWRSNFSTIEKAMKLAGGIKVTPTPHNTLMIGLFGAAKEFAEVDKNLFREVQPFKGLGPFRTDMLAFQENAAGEITGFVVAGAPFMSTYRIPFYEGTLFNGVLAGLAMLMFIGVWLRLAYQRPAYKALPGAEKAAYRASLLAAGSNLAVLVVGLIVVLSVASRLSGEIPLAFKLWLVLPLIAFVAGLYQLFQMVQVWRHGLLRGVFARLRYSAVTLAALFMCWFYWYWNILGFQYKS